MTQAEITAITVAVIAALNGHKPLNHKGDIKRGMARKAKFDTRKAVKAAPKSQLDRRAERKLQLELLTKEAFEKAGFENVIPRVNVMTAGLWATQGKTVVNGQLPLWVKGPWMSAKQMGYPMFHASQVA